MNAVLRLQAPIIINEKKGNRFSPKKKTKEKKKEKERESIKSIIECQSLMPMVWDHSNNDFKKLVLNSTTVNFP